MTTGSADEVSRSGATLTGSFSEASSQPSSIGFEYGTSPSGLSESQDWEGAIPEQSGNYDITLTGLTANTTYYYRAVVEVDGQDFYGETLSFTTLRSVAGNHYGWLELPALSGNESYVGSFYSSGTTGTSANRNYTYNYNYPYYAALWVAYPLCYAQTVKADGITGPDWTYNSCFSTSYQVNVVSSSYPTMYGASDYARGHQIPNADRHSNQTMKDQTYLVTNQTPQLQTAFNATIWGTLEKDVRALTSSTDTVYVVTGACFRKKNGSETINYLTGAKSSANPASLPIPNYYWKALLKVKRTAGAVTSASAIGVWLEHRNYSDSNWSAGVVSVDQIEEWTGFDFFANVPRSLEAAAEANADWDTFSSF